MFCIKIICCCHFRVLKHVQALVAEYENAKKEENEQRTLYKNEKDELEQEIVQLETRLQSSSVVDLADNEKFKQIEEQYQLVADRLQKQRLILVNYIQLLFFLNSFMLYSN